MDTATVIAGDTTHHVSGVPGGGETVTTTTRVSELFRLAGELGLRPSEVWRVKRAYTVQEAAEYLAVSVSTVRQLIRDDRLPARKSGAKVLLDVRDLDAFFESLPEVA